MKRFSKMLALGMALSLAFGVTVCAANSPTVDTSGLGEKVDIAVPDGMLEAGQKLVAEDMDQADKDNVTKTITESGMLKKIGAAAKVAEGKKATAKLVKTFELEVRKDNKKVDTGIVMTFSWEGFEATKKYVVLHFNGTDWDVIAPTSAGKDSITVIFDSLSPVAIVEVGEEVADTGNNNTGNTNNNTNNNNNNSQNEAPKSPATGETLPVAGIMALICLAGAAVCAGKVRYNKQ